MRMNHRFFEVEISSLAMRDKVMYPFPSLHDKNDLLRQQSNPALVLIPRPYPTQRLQRLWDVPKPVAEELSLQKPDKVASMLRHVTRARGDEDRPDEDMSALDALWE